MKIISMIAFVVALGLAWTGAAIPQTTEKAADKAESKTEKAKDKMKEAGEKVKDKAVEAKDKVKAAVKGGGDRLAAENVKANQEALKAKGFDPGPIDGVHGPRTTAAVRDFQRQQGLQVSGKLDMATRSQLGTDTGRSDSGATPSASPPSEMKRKPQTP